MVVLQFQIWCKLEHRMIRERNTFAFHNSQGMTHNAQMHMQLNNENESKLCRYAYMH